MKQISKILHVLAVGLWLGSAVFFVIVALVVFRSFESLGSSSDRPGWLALPANFDKEMGRRLAGAALAPVFDCYFPLQFICAYIAVVTGFSLALDEPSRRIHRIRNLVLLLAMATVAVGWLVADHVAVLRIERYSPIQSVADHAESIFAAWHGVSLALNMITIGLVTVAMALAAQMPATSSRQKEPVETEASTAS